MPSLKVINSKTVNPKEHGSRNNTPIKAIGVFEFVIEPHASSDFLIFTFPNTAQQKTEYIIIPRNVLLERFAKSKQKRIEGNQVNFVLWLLPNNYLFDATNIGIEGEWFFIGGNMAEGTDMDYTNYLNNWDLLKER